MVGNDHQSIIHKSTSCTRGQRGGIGRAVHVPQSAVESQSDGARLSFVVAHRVDRDRSIVVFR